MLIALPSAKSVNMRLTTRASSGIISGLKPSALKRPVLSKLVSPTGLVL
ncbi:MAG: hypothetical protein R3A13_01390 [Bdellovibrionota bacterium]